MLPPLLPKTLNISVDQEGEKKDSSCPYLSMAPPQSIEIYELCGSSEEIDSNYHNSSAHLDFDDGWGQSTRTVLNVSALVVNPS